MQMQDSKIIESTQGRSFAFFEPCFERYEIQKFQNELKGKIFRRTLRRLKIFLCDHKRTVFIFRTRHYTTTPGTNFRFWQDCVVGIACCDCGKVMPAIMPLDIGNIDHLGFVYSSRNPHFPEF